MRMLISALLLAVAVGAHAASKEEIDAEVKEAIANFHKHTSAGKELSRKAAGMLVFPTVVKAGIGIGGEYGEGALRIGGKTVDYYSTASASIGLQLGGQQKTIILVFLQDEALKQFRDSSGWKAGVDGSVALIKVGADGAIDTTTIKDPIVGFVFSQKGLMYNLTLEGSKFTKLDRSKE